MREILFRGQRADNGEWVEGYFVAVNSKCYIGQEVVETTKTVSFSTETCLSETWYGLDKFYEVIPETVGQYTGLTDKNGKKIFEEDIVKATIRRCYGSNPQIREETKIIDYDNLGILGLKDVENVWSDFMNELSLSGGIEDFYFEVIGNLHDNPELLKGGAEE